jgi:hypothetical protein
VGAAWPASAHPMDTSSKAHCKLLFFTTTSISQSVSLGNLPIQMCI